MGIGSIISAGLKNIPWTSLVMNYAPEIMRKLKEQVRPHTVDEAGITDKAVERIEELEKVAAEQAAIMEQQQQHIVFLETTSEKLETQVRSLRIISAVLVVLAVILLIVLITR